jgi:peptidoglycan hydrolase-like protein with peptidoglycan-binding domain
MSKSRFYLITGSLVVALSIAWSCSPAWGTPPRHRPPPARSTVLTVQSLFHMLGYPLGREPRGDFGTRTRGALDYFQRKYRLPITGYPDARTVSEMRTVAFSLLSRPGSSLPPPQDLVTRLLGNLPVFPIAVALALLLCALALSGRRAPVPTDRA